jgi:hypothetical protein
VWKSSIGESLKKLQMKLQAVCRKEEYASPTRTLEEARSLEPKKLTEIVSDYVFQT